MLNRVLLRACDYLFVLRPLILIPAWSFYLLGVRAAGAKPAGMGFGLPGPAAFLSLTCILITAYLINQVFDQEADEKNGKCFYISRGIFQARTIVLLALLFFVGASLAFHRIDDVLRIPLFVALLLSLLYSLPPIRLCSRPYADLVANAVGYGGVAFVIGFAQYGPMKDGLLQSIPYVQLVGATFLHTAIMDVEGDRAAGKKTTVVHIGVRASQSFAAVLHLLAVLAAVLVVHRTGSPWALIVTGASLPFTLYALARGNSNTSTMLAQTNTLVVALAAAVCWPAFLAVVLPLTVLSRYYHRRRFGIIYPGPRRVA